MSRLGQTFSTYNSLIGYLQWASEGGGAALSTAKGQDLAYKIISSQHCCVNGEDRCLICTSLQLFFLMANKKKTSLKVKDT